ISSTIYLPIHKHFYTKFGCIFVTIQRNNLKATTNGVNIGFARLRGVHSSDRQAALPPPGAMSPYRDSLKNYAE
ncbi:MAG: hypothetical protein U9Q58_04230, partial [Pseudomonadota bacterium]|nr:hypothetical protein [Pseudomonadota bacterium]